MAKNFGRLPTTDASKLHVQTRTRFFVETENGLEERIGRIPQGRVVSFVDKEGNVLPLQIHADGDQKKAETERRKRGEYHAKGFIELGLCPLLAGTRQYALRDFAKMPAALNEQCQSHPKLYERHGGDTYAKHGCPHIEWLIEHRRAEAARACALRNAHVAAAEAARKKEAELKDLQAELLKEQIEERRTKNSRRQAKESAE